MVAVISNALYRVLIRIRRWIGLRKLGEMMNVPMMVRMPTIERAEPARSAISMARSWASDKTMMGHGIFACLDAKDAAEKEVTVACTDNI
jgi:hypothetical protein